ALPANAGNVVQLLFPSSVGGVVPVPDAVKQAVSPLLPLANYPIRAEARTGTQPDGKYDAPGTTLTAHAEDNKVEAVAAVNGADQPGAATYGSMDSHSTSALIENGSKGQALATSTVNNIGIGSAIKI